MNLRQMECPLDLEIAEDLASVFEDEDTSITWYEKEPNKWIFQLIYAFAFELSLKDKMRAFFKERRLLVPAIDIKPLPEKDWVSVVHRDSPPLTLGKFYVYGSHIQGSIPSQLIPLQIDAATAFGSGQHESTAGCLKALSDLSEQYAFHHPLDMGCGSGILALAMALLWKEQVLACDNDPEAVRVTTENARINNLDSFIEIKISEGFSAIKNRTFDVITANILAGPLCQMAGEVVRSLMPGGFIILAGLLNRQAEDVIDAYRSVGTKLFDQLFINDWSTLILRKSGHE